MAKCAQCGRTLPAFSFRKVCEWCIRHEAAQRGEEEDAIQPVMPVPWAHTNHSSGMVAAHEVLRFSMASVLAEQSREYRLSMSERSFQLAAYK
jgi:hypothetical protein